MRADDSESASIEETAVDWFVRRRDRLPLEAEREYQAWLGADPRHAAAMARCRATWSAVSYPLTANRGREAARILDRWEAARRRRPWLVAGAGLAAAAVLALLFVPLGFRPKAAPAIAAVAVRPNLKELPDGSNVELNAGAEIAVQFSPGRRVVRLIHGEAFFSVAKDPDRPFVVSAQGVGVRAVGTAFSVRSSPETVGVLVAEGRVAVEREAPDAPAGPVAGAADLSPHPIYLDAGRRVVLAADRTAAVSPDITPLSADELGAALAWRNKRVEFSRMPLSDVAALFNSQNRVQLSIADHATARIPISGIYWADDPEGFVRLLESGLEVRAERSADSIRLSSR